MSRTRYIATIVSWIVLVGCEREEMETSHRHGELFWAGRDRNWPYAKYQLDKLETAIANGVERRPKRAASARMLDGAVVSLRNAIESEDSASFDRAFDGLTRTCNACHRAEGMSFARVSPPPVRCSPVRSAESPEDQTQEGKP